MNNVNLIEDLHSKANEVKTQINSQCEQYVGGYLYYPGHRTIMSERVTGVDSIKENGIVFKSISVFYDEKSTDANINTDSRIYVQFSDIVRRYSNDGEQFNECLEKALVIIQQKLNKYN
jgi:hypothetical protein